MPTFIFKIQKQEIEFQNIPDGEVKGMFESLQKTISDQLQSLQCRTHLQKPVIILESDGKKVKLAGFGTCCREFGFTVQQLIKLPNGSMDSDVIVTTREMTYTHGS
jgi:hypothetical protein